MVYLLKMVIFHGFKEKQMVVGMVSCDENDT
jgi:hypothetical protein